MLDDNHRLPLLLKYITGLTEAETAEVLGLSISTVKSRLYTARQRLKKQIADLEGGTDMALDKRIKQALEQNSKWDGSADLLWESIAAKLRPNGARGIPKRWPGL